MLAPALVVLLLTAEPAQTDLVDSTDAAGKHRHIWLVNLNDLPGETKIASLRLTLVYGPGCGPPVSIWRRFLVGAAIAGAAATGGGAGQAVTGLVGAVAPALLAAPPRLALFAGSELSDAGGGWYALRFKCEHLEGALPAARLIVRLPSDDLTTSRLVLATPWRPLAAAADTAAAEP